jgi:hypothetical protein
LTTCTGLRIPDRVAPTYVRVERSEWGAARCLSHPWRRTPRPPPSSRNVSTRSGLAFLVHRDADGKQHLTRLGVCRRTGCPWGDRLPPTRRLDGTSRSPEYTRRSSGSATNWTVVDDGLSRNGTFHNGERAGPQAPGRRRHAAIRRDARGLPESGARRRRGQRHGRRKRAARRSGTLRLTAQGTAGALPALEGCGCLRHAGQQPADRRFSAGSFASASSELEWKTDR